MAARIRAAEPAILAANAKDMAGGRDKGLTGAMLDRLELPPHASRQWRRVSKR
jgi:glutamate-5-semialdehyde dehydrogenase